MAKPNARELKLNIKAGKYPEKVLKELERSAGRIKKIYGEIPKELKDWEMGILMVNKKLTDVNKNIDKETRALEIQLATYNTLSAAKQKGAQREIDAINKKLDKLNKEKAAYEKASQSAKQFLKMERGAGGGAFGQHLDAFKQGGVRGLGGSLMSSGVGKLGVAGALGYGAYKTWDWLSNKGEQGKAHLSTVYDIRRRAGVVGSTIGSRKGIEDMANKGMSATEVKALLSGTVAATGGMLVGNKGVTNDMADFMLKNRLGATEMTGFMGEMTGVGMFDKGNKRAEAGKAMSTLEASMVSGLASGFDKSKRIAQLVSIQQDMATGTGEISSDTLQKSAILLDMLEGTGRRQFKGEGGVKMLAGMNAIFKSGSDSNKALFASMVQSGLLGSEVGSKYQSAYGELSKTSGFNQLNELDKQGMIMDRLLGDANGFSAFKGMMEGFKDTGMGASIISDVTGMDSGMVARLMTEMDKGNLTKAKYDEIKSEYDTGARAPEALKDKELQVKQIDAERELKDTVLSLGALAATLDVNLAVLKKVNDALSFLADNANNAGAGLVMYDYNKTGYEKDALAP